MSLHRYVALDLKISDSDARAVVNAMTVHERAAASGAIRRAGANLVGWRPGTLAALIPARTRRPATATARRPVAAPAPSSWRPARAPIPAGASRAPGDDLASWAADRRDDLAAIGKAKTRQWFAPAPGSY